MSEAFQKAAAPCDDCYCANDEPIAERLFAWIGRTRAQIRVP